MIVGSGQLAHTFESCDDDGVVYFASGVANSNCTEMEQFEREKNLLIKTLEQNKDKIFVYFSSCALSAIEYPKNAYYMHKQAMEELIKVNSAQYYIFRIPQLFGRLKHHRTLINFLYESILNGEQFIAYKDAYRYVIEIADVRVLVQAYLLYSDANAIVDLANPYRYKVLDIINILEIILDKKANYEVLDKEDSYVLDLNNLICFVKEHNVPVNFSEDYLYTKLKSKIDGSKSTEE